ncbi:flagellar hook-associated protein FlgK [Alcaligenes sp. WGS1538]|uniref:flagellar hook-associated protein FlgK n=1 Tax=Alcaligenes sp. WGS1538 TaxID=3366811 RepID=UPI00372D0EE7
MNLANLGLSGLFAAQQRMQVAGHNLNNVDTEGYNRQTVLSQTAGAVGTSAGYIGRGVQAVTVQRSYDNFLYQQLVRSRTAGAALVSYGNEISQLDNLFSDRTVGISPAIQKFFEGIQAVASAPADSAARQELLGRAESLATQINDATAYMNRVSENINTQLSTTVTQINSYLERINDVNNQIVRAKGTTPGHEPNDLLDQREQLVAELSQLVDVRTVEQNGRISVTTVGGQLLLGADKVYPLHAVKSAQDPERVVVAYTSSFDAQGQEVKSELRDTSLKGGTLGGLLQFRQESLDPTINSLGRLALGLANSVNALHEQGIDLQGNPGKAFFSIGGPKVIGNANNSSSAQSPAVSISDVNQLQGRDYRLEYDGTDYKLVDLTTGVQHAIDPSQPTVIDGVSIDVSGMTGGQAGDSWLIQPTRNAGSSLAVEIKNPQDIAAAAAGTGTANGDIALKLAELQNQKVLGQGSLSLNDAYSQIVNRVAVQTQQNGSAAKAQAKLIQQNFAAQQSVSGVNQDEEYIKLERYQEQYRAASRLIDISSKMFDTLLALRA